ncbi:hypothetical protein COO60DRAFT_445221 [Scenedesmus sp. NREL 46B-D3]|nr:hypothetical protein COO60DRAFT_445221 [Scenedesmus sp. NREL 46B-D3]
MSEEYYAEDTFGGGLATSKVYTGPFLGVGFSTILGCFGMASITKRSPNLSFRWLQRRVGAQFMTVAYCFTVNILYYHDGRCWRTRDVGHSSASVCAACAGMGAPQASSSKEGHRICHRRPAPAIAQMQGWLWQQGLCTDTMFAAAAAWRTACREVIRYTHAVHVCWSTKCTALQTVLAEPLWLLHCYSIAVSCVFEMLIEHKPWHIV